MTITMRDVARAAGVAEKTVSRVINREQYVSAAARARVEAAIAELGYAPNVAAQRLASNRAFTIAMAVDRASGQYLAATLFSVIDAAAARGYAVVVVRVDLDNAGSLARLADVARRKQADGALLPALLDERRMALAALLPPGFPVVQRGEGAPETPSVSAEQAAGAEAMTQHLLDLGHRRIAFLTNTRRAWGGLRLAAFERVMACHGVPVDPRYVVAPDEFGFAGGRQAGETLLRLDPRPTAIFAANDAAAVGVMAAALELGLRVPADVSVAGFDDFPVAQEVRPTLTTVRLPVEELGRRATDMLIDLIEGRPVVEPHVRLGVEVVARESTAELRIKN